MARINRSEAVANQQMASTPRTRPQPYIHRPTLPLSRVLGLVAWIAVGTVALSYIL